MRFSSPRLLASAAVLLLSPAVGLQAQTTQVSWIGTWAASPSPMPDKVGAIPAETTLREIVHISRGGTAVRVTFTNELGTDPLTISAAHLAARAQESGVAPGTDRPLLFGGQPGIVIPSGAVAVSDALPMNVAALTDLAVSVLLPPQPVHTITGHPLGLQTNYEAAGDQLAAPTLTEPKPFAQWRFLKNVEVSGGAPGGAIVTLGDSITDGFKSTPDADHRWPDNLARRLQADPRLSGMGVLNEGISGNRILHDIAGPNALARFDRDVLSQDGVRYLIILEGINDIGRTFQPRNPGDEVTAQQLIVAYQQMIERAHAHGIKVIGATLTPFLGAGYASPSGETMRQTLNTWIRTPGHFDGFIDFDQVTRDPAQPGVFSSAADSGDHLHPSDAGYKSMSDSIDLKLFTR